MGAALAFVSFGLCASATYIVNDLLDIDSDRRHHSKRRRPFAAGNLSAISGVVVVVLFLAAATALAFALPHLLARLGPGPWTGHSFLEWLFVYAVTTTAYSFVLKRIVLVDVLVLSGLYTVRIFAGAAASNNPVTTWLGGFSVFFFLSLAFIKRFAELESLRLRDEIPTNGRGYVLGDIEQLRSFGYDGRLRLDHRAAALHLATRHTTCTITPRGFGCCCRCCCCGSRSFGCWPAAAR